MNAEEEHHVPSRCCSPQVANVYHTIGICTSNRKEVVVDTLARLFDLVALPSQTEVIVVNNGNEVDSEYILNSIAEIDKRDISFALYFEARPGLSFARNKVIDVARGDIVSFVDDDAFPESQFWQLAVLEVFGKHEKVAVVGGPTWLVPPDGSKKDPWWRSNRTDVYFSCLREYTTGQCPPGLIAGVNASYRAAAIHCNRFATELGWGHGKRLSVAGEDTLFNEQVCSSGWLAWFESRAIVLHCIEASRFNSAWTLRRAFIGGKTEAVFHVIDGRNLSSMYVPAAEQLVKSALKAVIRGVLWKPSDFFAELCNIASRLAILSTRNVSVLPRRY